MRKQWLVLLVAVLSSAALWGCGSGGGSGGSVEVTTLADVAAVGSANCATCHESISEGWLAGNAHGNANTRPALDFFGHLPVEDCAVCHDPKGEGEAFFAAFGELNRPVVGCESCHGDGSAHRGIGPIPTPRPDWEECATCHDDAHGDYALASAVGASAHNNSDDLHASAARCQRCHTSEGAVALAAYTGDADVMHEMDDIAPLDLEENLHPVTCVACHDAHSGALRADSFIVNDNALASGNWDPNGNGTADQFDFCTSCHTYYNQDGILIGSGSAASGTAAFYHNTAWYRTITSTHYDNPATGYGLAENIVEGYVIRENSADPCFDCHGHELRTNTRRSQQEPDPADPDLGPTIHTQWATSGHAGGLLNEKYAADSGARSEDNVDAVMAAGASDASSGGGFTHYDWDATNRQSCQMCHTATGFMNYVADPATYDAANNDFSHLAGWTPGGNSTQNELLYCWGCHSDAGTGELRVTGAVTAVYTYGGAPVVFPDVGNSNSCVVCHSGRGNNENVSGSSRFAGHHAPAAADLFSEYSHVAYEYPGLDYTNKSYFAHDSIDAANNGPCVACHMNGNGDHTFKVVEKDDSGVITGINADVCVSCHDGEHALFVAQGQVGETVNIWNGTAAVATVVTQQMADAAAATLETESEEYQEAGQLLLDLLNQANGLTNYAAATINNSSAADNDKGAFQNSKLPSDEPGGFAHNRYYVKRALFDAIDWVEDGAIDGTISDFSALGTAYQYAGAMTWLGTTRP